MKNNSRTSKSMKILSTFSKTIESIQKYVENKYFPFVVVQEWELSESNFVSAFAKKVHWLFSPTKRNPLLQIFMPASITTSIALILGFAFHIILPIFFHYGRLIMIGQFYLSWYRTVAILLIAFLVIFLIMFSAIGVYWRIYEIARNKKISRIAKLILLLMIGIFCYGFMFEIKIYRLMDIFSLINVSQNMCALVISLVFIYIPITLYFGIFFGKMAVFGLTFLWRLLQWFYLIQITHSQETFMEFLATPFQQHGNIDQKTILEFDTANLLAIETWVKSRRQTIQNKLIPASLGIAFLGILASTSLGENTLGFVSSVFSEYFSAFLKLSEPDGSSFAVMISLAKYLALMGIIGIIVSPLAWLLREITIIDFIAEACALAESIKMIQKKDVKKRPASEIKPIRKSRRKN